MQVSNGPPEALQTGPGPVRTPTKEVSNASRHPSRAAQATLALPAACEPGQLAPASLNRARDCPAPCSYCRQQGRKRAQSAMLASNTASSDLSGCCTTASARLVAGGMPAPRCSELTAPRTRLKAEGRRRLRLAAGERKLRHSPQTWRREPAGYAATAAARFVAIGTSAPPCAASLKRPRLGQSWGSDGGRPEVRLPATSNGAKRRRDGAASRSRVRCDRRREARGDGGASTALRRLPQRPRLGQSRWSDGGRCTPDGDLKRRRAPQRQRREPQPGVSRPPPRGSWRWRRQRRPPPTP